MTIGGFDVSTIVYVILLFFMFVMVYRYRYNKLAKENMRIFFSTDEGSGYFKWMPIVNGKVFIKPTATRAGAIYPLGNLNTVNIDFPENVPALLSFVQVKAKMTVLDEHTAEPILNRGAKLKITPQSIFNTDQERFTGLAAGQSAMERQEANKDLPKLKVSSGSNTKYVIIFIVVAILVVAGIILWQKFGGGRTPSPAELGIP